MGKTIKTSVDHHKCVGSRICTAIAPKAFALNSEGQAQPIDPPHESIDVIRMASEGCPVSAITIEESD